MDSIRREVREEIGVRILGGAQVGQLFDIDIHEIPEREGLKSHFHYDLRFLIVVSHDVELEMNPEECDDARWFDLTTAAEKMESRAGTRVFSKLAF